MRGAGRCFLAALLRGRRVSMGEEPHVPDTAPRQLRAPGLGQRALCRAPAAPPASGETPGLRHHLGIRARRTSGRAEINCHTAGQGGKWKRN